MIEQSPSQQPDRPPPPRPVAPAASGSSPPVSAARSGLQFGTIAASCVTAAVTTLLVANPFWSSQQRRLQQWSSRPVVDFVFTGAPSLTISNRGAVDISQISIGLTAYRVKGTVHREKGKSSFSPSDELEMFTKYPGPLKEIALISSGTSEVWDLTTPRPDQFRFEFYEPSDPDDTHFQRHYALRIVFRNAVSLQKHVKYVTVPAMRDASVLAISDDTWYGSIGVDDDLNPDNSRRGRFW